MLPLFIRRLLFASSLFAVTVPLASAQHVVEGSVRDAETGDVLPSAALYVEGTYNGTITNQDGAFELRVTGLPAVLVTRYIGYQTQRIEVFESSDRQLDVRLQPVRLSLPEIVVTDGNPALEIMECVLRAKRARQDRLHSYAADVYTRMTVSNDTGIVSIAESLSDLHWSRKLGRREVMLARRQTANLEVDEFLPDSESLVSLYDDDVEFAGFTFVGVTHPDALEHYRFELLGQRMLDDQLVYDIGAAPKHRLKTAFSGTLAVLAESCMVLEMKLAPGDAFMFPAPIKRVDVAFEQKFSDFGSDIYLPTHLQADMEFEVAFGPLLRFPAFHFRQLSRISGYEIDAEAPDSLFRKKDYLTMRAEASTSDSLLDQPAVTVPLTQTERVAYAAIDSTHTLEKAFQPQGALGRLAQMENDQEADTSDRERSPLRAALGHVNFDPRLRYNRVEGLSVGGQVSPTFGSTELTAAAGWSFAHEDAWYRASVRQHLLQRSHVDAAYSSGVEPLYRSSVYPQELASIYLLFGGEDYFDYFGVERFSFSAGHRMRDIPLRLDASFSRESPHSVSMRTGYDLIGRREPRPNPAVSEEAVSTIATQLQLGDRDNSFGVAERRRLTLRAAYGRQDGSSAFGGGELALDVRIPTFFQRRLIPNALDLRITGGSQWGDVPAHRLYVVDASLGPFRPFGTLRTRTGRPYIGERYVSVFWEHNFRTVPFELLDLQGLANRGYGLILTGAHARTWAAGDELLFSNMVPDQFHHELGVSLSGVLGLFRIDLTFRLDEKATTVGFGPARIF